MNTNKPMPSLLGAALRNGLMLLRPGRSYIIGRLLTCDIFLPHDKVSREHAKLVPHADGSFHIEDLQSSNGTHVNDRSIIGPHTLSHNDIIRVGPFEVTFVTKAPDYSTGSDMNETKSGEAEVENSQRPQLMGEFQQDGLAEICMFLEQNSKTGNFFARSGGEVGKLGFHNGIITSGKLGQNTDESIVFTVMCFETGNYEFFETDEVPEPEFSLRPTGLTMEILRRRDEAGISDVTETVHDFADDDLASLEETNVTLAPFEDLPEELMDPTEIDTIRDSVDIPFPLEPKKSGARIFWILCFLLLVGLIGDKLANNGELTKKLLSSFNNSVPTVVPKPKPPEPPVKPVTPVKPVKPQKPAPIDHYKDAMAAMENGYLEEALLKFNQAIETDSGHTNALFHRAQVLAERGEFESAQKDLKKVLHKTPEDKIVLKLLALCRQRIGDAFFLEGDAKAKKGDMKGALKAYKRGFKADPKNAKARLTRGIWRKNAGDNAGAIKDFTTFLKLKPKNGDALFHRAVCKIRAGKMKSGALDFKKCLALDPKRDQAPRMRRFIKKHLEK